MSAIQQIIEMNKISMPDMADVFTEEWVVRLCADLNESPEQLLAQMLQNRANLEQLEEKAFPPGTPEWKKQQILEG